MSDLGKALGPDVNDTLRDLLEQIARTPGTYFHLTVKMRKDRVVIRTLELSNDDYLGTLQAENAYLRETLARVVGKPPMNEPLTIFYATEAAYRAARAVAGVDDEGPPARVATDPETD